MSVISSGSPSFPTSSSDFSFRTHDQADGGQGTKELADMTPEELAQVAKNGTDPATKATAAEMLRAGESTDENSPDMSDDDSSDEV